MSASTFLSITADYSKRSGFCGDFYVDFSGDIDANSMASLRSAIERIENRFNPGLLALSLDSDGGDVWQALAFARFIRAHHLTNLIVQVVEGRRCYSSCVFILAGGIQRFVPEGGTIGIHRPYFTDQVIYEAGYKSLQQAYDGLLPRIKTFLDSVNISDQLASDMWLVSSDKLRVLTDTELKQYGLSEDDAVFKELQNSNLRAACGNDAPENYNDWLANAFGPCQIGGGKFDGVCLQEKTRKHPYCRCFVASNSRFTCD